MSILLRDTQPPPTEDKLRKLVLAGPETIDVAQQLIDKHKLPFIIKDGQLRSAFTQGELFLSKFITLDQDMIEMKGEAAKAHPHPYEVLICGPTGTGKETLAKSMIGNREGAIKCVNCAGLPEHLVESMLFGYVSGAFTGANKTTDGLMKAAHNGLLFLDEIGEMPMHIQAKLLRALQERVITKIGGKEEEEINCRVVCATNRNLKKMVHEKTFREDFYARISPLELDTKPLSERECDVIPILESLEGGKEFLAAYSDELSKGLLDLSLNVRSLQRYVIQHKVWGRIKK